MKYLDTYALPNKFRNYKSGIPKIFATDCTYKNNWRRQHTADYKAQRVLVPKKFNKTFNKKNFWIFKKFNRSQYWTEL